MIDRRFEIDEWWVDECGHRRKPAIRQILGQVLTVGEGADAQRIAVGGEHRQAFADVLGGGAVHHYAITPLQLPAALSRRDDERGTPEARHGGLERGERAERWV